MTGVEANFTGFQQGNQNGSGAEGSAEEFVQVGFTGRAQSAAPGISQGRRGRTEEGERDFSRRRIPQASPRAQPYSTASAPQGMNMEHMFQQFLTAMTQMMRQGPQSNQNTQQGYGPVNGGEGERQGFSGRNKLEEKHFKRVKEFSGGRKKEDIDYKTWLFDLSVAICKVDSQLGAEVKKLVSKNIKEDWDPDLDPDLDLGVHEKYKE